MPKKDTGHFVSFRIDKWMAEEVNKRAKEAGITRSAWFRARVIEGLGYEDPLVKGASAFKDKGNFNQPHVPPVDADGNCVHPQNHRKITELMTLCTLCGSRI